MATNQPRVWLITGASSGFGRAIAEAALAAGDIVVAAARRTDALADLIASAPERVTALALDVTDTDRIRAAVGEVLDRHGRVDVLVNNAGRGAIGAAEETSDTELRDLMDLHFFGPAALPRRAARHARARHRRDRPNEQHGWAVHISGCRRVFRDEVRARGMVRGTRQGGRAARHPGADRRARCVPHVVQRARRVADLRGHPRIRRADRTAA